MSTGEPTQTLTLVPRPSSKVAYALAIAACVMTVLLAMPLRRYFDMVNIVMLFLLVTFMTALHLGRGPAVVSALLGVALFDYIFVPPHLDFVPTDAQYIVMLVVMLVVALMTGQLTAGAREQADLACMREEQTRRLYQLARTLAGARSPWDVQAALDGYLDHSGYRAMLDFHAGSGGGDGGSADAMALRLPLGADGRGDMVVAALGPASAPPAREREAFEVVASLVAIAVERLHDAEELQVSRDEAASERLRASILSALSHDLRTPLTALVGMADSLAYSDEQAPSPEKLTSIREQARAIGHMVANLLDMARLQAGKVSLRKEWQLLDDLVGTCLRQLRATHPEHPARVRLAPDLPLVEFDAMLMERVLGNLLENAAKYAPAGTTIEVEAWVADRLACLAVSDRGPGFPIRSLERMFSPFERGQPESASPGVGLGLAICRTIVEAHGGDIGAGNRPDGGARVVVRLPLGTPPAFDEDDADEYAP